MAKTLRKRRRKRKRKAHPRGNQSSKRGRPQPAKSSQPFTRKQKHILPSARWCHPPSGDTIFFCLLPKAVLGIRIRNRIRRICMFLGLRDPDPIVRGTDPAPDPTLFSLMCWADCLNNACKIKKLTQNFSEKFNFLDWRWCACGQVMRKKYEKKFFSWQP